MTRKGKNKKGGSTTENVVVPKVVQKVDEILPEIKNIESNFEKTVAGCSLLIDENKTPNNTQINILKKEQKILENLQNVEMSNTDLNNSATDKPKRKRNRNKNKTNQNETNDDVSIQQTDIKSTETVSDINSIIVENSSEGTLTSKKKRNRNKKSKMENSNESGETTSTENKIDLTESDIKTENLMEKQENKNNKTKKDNNSKKIKKDIEEKSDFHSSPIQFKNQLDEKLIENKIENQIENLVKNENGIFLKSETIPLTDKKKDDNNKKKNKGKKTEEKDIKKEEFSPKKDDDVKKEIETNKSQNSSSNKKNKKEKLSPDKSNAELDKKIELNEIEIISEVKVEKTTEKKMEKNKTESDLPPNPLSEVIPPTQESVKPKRPARGNKQTTPEQKTSSPIPGIPIETSIINKSPPELTKQKEEIKFMEETPKEPIKEAVKAKENKKHPKANKHKDSPEKTTKQDSHTSRLKSEEDDTSIEANKLVEVNKPKIPDMIRKEEVLCQKNEQKTPKENTMEKSEKKKKSEEKLVKIDSIPVIEQEIKSEIIKVEPKQEVKPPTLDTTKNESKVETKPEVKPIEISKVAPNIETKPEPKPAISEEKPIEVIKAEPKPFPKLEPKPVITEEKPIVVLKPEPKPKDKPMEIPKVEPKPAIIEVKPVEILKPVPKPEPELQLEKEKPPIPVAPKEMKSLADVLKEAPNVIKAQPAPSKSSENQLLSAALNELIESVDLIKTNVGEGSKSKITEKPTEETSSISKNVKRSDFVQSVDHGAKSLEKIDEKKLINDKKIKDEANNKQMENLSSESKTHELPEKTAQEKLDPVKFAPVKLIDILDAKMVVPEQQQGKSTGAIKKNSNKAAAPDQKIEVQKNTAEKPKIPAKPEHLNKTDRKSPMPATKTDAKEKKLNKKPEIAPKPTTLPPPPMKKPPPPVDDEDEEFIEYKFIPRQVFLATICQVRLFLDFIIFKDHL